jgi:hypothetical protein
MNVSVVIQLLQLVIALFQPDSKDIAQILSDIVRVAAQAYHTHAGKPIDPALIKPEATI